MIEAECDKYMPFMLTTTVMMQAVKNGIGREDAHEVIKEHAVATLRDLRAGKIRSNDLFERLANDERMPLNKTALDLILKEGKTHTGMARAQALDFASRVQAWLDRYPEAASYTPAPIL